MHRLLMPGRLLAALLTTAVTWPISTPLRADEPGALMLVLGRNYDAAALRDYAAALPPIYARFGGAYQVFTRDVSVLEGEFPYQSIVISRWPALENAQAFWNSKEYAQARKLREGNGEFDVFAMATLAANAPDARSTLNQPAGDLGPALELAGLLAGRFSSAEQAARDTDYDVVEAELVRIWPERTDGVWLYQEQAVLGPAGSVERARKTQPYFQRIVQLVPQGDDRVIRHTWEMHNPDPLIGAWQEPARFASLNNDLLKAAACPLPLTRISDQHWFSRFEQPCPNSWRGASTLSSQGVVTAQGFANWDRGFDNQGQQVWGPRRGGYQFTRSSRDHD
jgi:CpeT protein